MTLDQLVSYYVNLLIMQFYGLPKAVGMVSAFVTQGLASLIVLQVRSAFGLGTAVGAQLDCLGQLVGLQRSVPGFVPGTPEFAMPDYSDPAAGSYIGFATYGGPAPSGHWARYADSPTSYIMSDPLFMQLIQFVVAVRASNYSVAALAAIFFEFFGPLVTLTDGQNMTLTYTHSHTDPSPLFAIIQYLGLLPQPAGVAVTVVTS
jgi:hypothetical protein